MMEKIEVQHNMFLEVYNSDLFRYEAESVLIRKIDIDKCYIKHYRQDCANNDRDREPFSVITIEMKNGDKYEECYQNFTNYGLYLSYKEIKEMATNRYNSIKKQLSEEV